MLRLSATSVMLLTMSRHVDNLRCWSCEAPLDALPQPLSRHDQCPACFEVLHCCRLCKHFDRNAVDGCREDRAEPPVRKEEANFCDYFEPTATPHGANSTTKKAATKDGSAADKLEALFGGGDGGEEAPPADDARAKLDALFSSASDATPKD